MPGARRGDERLARLPYNDRVSERLEAVELRQAREEAARSAPAAAPSAETVSRPRLKVLHLGPDGQTGAEATPAEGGTEEAGPRVVLKGQGKDLALSQNDGPAPAGKPAK